ncbi:MAG: hypothetical protein Q9212_006426, partial [Teloschistes hypoglaucus]
MPSSPAEPDILDGIFAIRPCQPNMTIPSTQAIGTVSKVDSKPTEMSADRSNSASARPTNKGDPLQLLHLPLDILKDIVREIPHTNDLTSLALTCSALHALAIPCIYARFDIVWPDTPSHSEARQGVDALTPQYTRKFSLGNGPDEWIKEYLINRESGKMLGTLVALSLARMPNLQSFVWDMPTGILRDCWLALSSLGEGKPNGESSLESIWIRFHDNKEVITNPDWVPQPVPEHLSKCTSSSSTPLIWSYQNIEYPSFSVLPPLRSVNVMNIDEIAYFEELSVLLARSIDSLRKLRIGIARRVPHEGFASTVTDLVSLARDADLSTTYRGGLDLLLGKVCGANKRKNETSMAVLAPEKLSSDSSLKHDMSNTARPIPSAKHSATSGWFSQSHAPTISSQSDMTSPMNLDSTADPAGVLSGLVMKAIPTMPLGHRPFSNVVSAVPSPDTLAATANPPPDVTNTTDKGKQAWPPSVRKYVMRSLMEEKTTSDVKATEVEQKLKQTIQQSIEAGTLTTVDWDNLPLPQAMIRTERDRANNAQMPVNAILLNGNPIPLDGDHKVEAHSGGLPSNSSSLDGLVNTRHQIQGQAAQGKATTLCPTASPLSEEQKQLRLEVLELETVFLSVPALLSAIDWSVLTTLTLLHCDNHEQLWKALRRTFAPRMTSLTAPDVSKPLSRLNISQPARFTSTLASEYRLNLRRIHTDTVSLALIQFLKETLAPNSLEWLFLQDGGVVTSEQLGVRESYASTVTVDQIFRGPLRRHRSSLKKIVIDSAGLGPTRWRKWKVDREILTYVVSGKMGALREVAFCLDYKDW